MVVSIGFGTAELLANIAKMAGSEIMRIYATDFTAETKADKSPVTQADNIAEELIIRGIREGVTSKWPIVAEEAVSRGEIPEINNGPFGLIDPLDGTKEFINRNGEFTVNIALINNGEPILGIVHAPAKKITYVGFQEGVFCQKGEGDGVPITVRSPTIKGLIAVLSRNHANERSVGYLKKYQIENTIETGSSLKFCQIAEGSADIYPRLAPTMEWDTAAGHAILSFAGGAIVTLEDAPLKYGKPNFRNPHFLAHSANINDFKHNGT